VAGQERLGHGLLLRALHDAGKTVVTQTEDSSVSYNAGVFLNLLMRVGQSPASAVPMVQVGASPNPEAPTVFVGLGLRLFGATNGGFAVSDGLAIPWVRTLDTKKLPLGTEVERTTAIEKNMVYRFQRNKWHLTLPYTF
jgi:hypothetical protein